jgi:hypothetical protein
MKRVRSFFTCRRVRRILLRAQWGEASPGEVARVRKHLNVCAECREVEKFLGSLASVWRERQVPEPDPALRERALHAAIRGGEAKQRFERRPGSVGPVVRWASLTAGVAFCLAVAILLREEPRSPQKETSGVTKNLEWSNGLEESLARIGEETAALRVGVSSADRVVDPVGRGLSRVENAVSDLRLSTDQPWSYSFERRLCGVSAAAEDLLTTLDSF